MPRREPPEHQRDEPRPSREERPSRPEREPTPDRGWPTNQPDRDKQIHVEPDNPWPRRGR
jgi:hypothetical protein